MTEGRDKRMKIERSRLISLRLTPAEFELASSRARESGNTVSQVLRDGLMGKREEYQRYPQATFVNGALHSFVANVSWTLR